MPYRPHLKIIDAWPSLREFASDIGASYNTAKHIRRRGRIPPGYWPAAVAHADRHGIAGVTVDRLATLYAAHAKPVPEMEAR